MNILPAHLAALCRLGYSDQEATFIYLVATHSGYFTRPQFLRFTRQTKGGILHRFTTKLPALGHVRATEYGRQMLVFHLYSRLVYGPIGKDNLRNRRRLSNELVRTRLLILDFVLANLDSQYLETEAAKVSYFHETLRLPLAILPGRRYTGLKSASHTDRYFVDRFPILISRSLPSVPTFVYCDSDPPGLRPYFTYLRAYERLWRCLERFHFITYAAPGPKKFRGAEARFSQMFAPAPAINTKRLARYFEVRLLWESHKTSSPAPTGICCAMATSDIRENRLSPPTKNGHPVACPELVDAPFWTAGRKRRVRSGVHLAVQLSVTQVLVEQGFSHGPKPKTDAAQAPKKLLVAGSDPISASRFSAKIPSGFGGRSRPRYPQKFVSLEPVPRRFPC